MVIIRFLALGKTMTSLFARNERLLWRTRFSTTEMPSQFLTQYNTIKSWQFSLFSLKLSLQSTHIHERPSRSLQTAWHAVCRLREVSRLHGTSTLDSSLDKSQMKSILRPLTRIQGEKWMISNQEHTCLVVFSLEKTRFCIVCLCFRALEIYAKFGGTKELQSFSQILWVKDSFITLLNTLGADSL